MNAARPGFAGRLRAACALWLVAVIAAMGLAQPACAQSVKMPRVGVIGEQAVGEPRLEALRQGLRELGYVDGQNIAIEYRYLHGAVERAPELVSELLRLKVDVLVVGGTVAAQAAKATTSTVPIVFAVAADPVASGLVASLGHPGGNVTGLSSLLPELSGKQLELLKAAAPRVSRIALLFNPVNPAARSAAQGARQGAQALGVELQAWEVRQQSDLPPAFAALTAWRAGAVLVVSDPLFGNELGRLSSLAAANRLPAIYNRREFAEAGGLMSYGPNFSVNYRRAAGYVDKILKGAKPADLPVEQPTTFELVINLKAAKALGLTLSPSLLLRADEVIQ